MVPVAPSGSATTTLAITGMTCAKGCASKIHRSLQALEGVSLATVDFQTVTACVRGNVLPADLIACVQGAGPTGKFNAVELHQAESVCL